MLDELLMAFALMLVLEGIMPFLCPSCWRNWVMKMMRLSDQRIRVVGLVTMILGILMLYVVSYFMGEW